MWHPHHHSESTYPSSSSDQSSAQQSNTVNQVFHPSWHYEQQSPQFVDRFTQTTPSGIWFDYSFYPRQQLNEFLPYEPVPSHQPIPHSGSYEADTAWPTATMRDAGSELQADDDHYHNVIHTSYQPEHFHSSHSGSLHMQEHYAPQENPIIGQGKGIASTSHLNAPYQSSIEQLPSFGSLSEDEQGSIIAQLWRAHQGKLKEHLNTLTKDLVFETFLRNVTPEKLHHFRTAHSAEDIRLALEELLQIPDVFNARAMLNSRREKTIKHVKKMFNIKTDEEASRYLVNLFGHHPFLRKLLSSTDENIWKYALDRIPPTQGYSIDPKYPIVVPVLGTTLNDIFEKHVFNANAIVRKLNKRWNCDNYDVDVYLRKKYRTMPEVVEALGNRHTFPEAEERLRPIDMPLMFPNLARTG